jgi:pyrroloquinoline-quinone synthase
MADFFDRADAVCAQHNVLAHPFYERWSRGELSRQELATYSGQYRHAVVALAQATAQAGNQAHAQEEQEHIELWDQFVAAVGGDPEAPANQSTTVCVRAWNDPSRDRVATLAVLYAIESSQPAISETKRTGLLEHYGALPNSDSTLYFDVHADLDRAHAAEDRQQLSQVLGPGDEPRLLAEIEKALRGNWRLLDGLEMDEKIPA